MKKALIVLGAGASKDFCGIFPTGLELIKEINYHFLTEKKSPSVRNFEGVYLSALMNHISKDFGNDEMLFRTIKNQLWNVQLDYEWRSLRRKADNPISIDSFIDKKIREGNLDSKAIDIIKYCIYYLIKGTEQALDEGLHELTGNWIEKLARKLSKYDLETIIENLTIITFNYDRTFEKFFPINLIKYIDLKAHQILSLQNSVQHVYGCLGSLGAIPFDLANDKVDIIYNNYKEIKLIGDRDTRTLPLSDTNQYRDIHFIGFGFDTVNMNLINLDRFTAAAFQGTAYNYTIDQINEVKKKYNIDVANVSCKDYIEKLNI